jgi:hypothetical protein
MGSQEFRLRRISEQDTIPKLALRLPRDGLEQAVAKRLSSGCKVPVQYLSSICPVRNSGTES